MPGLQEEQPRRLEKYEHDRTRPLWEEAFSEDSQQFLDYYYRNKTEDNEIWVVEKQGEIVSMLHLNPYVFRIRERLVPVHYIVAVATKKEWRHRGYMRRLMGCVMEKMAENAEPFTFLMPAAKEIYEPFGFQYIYRQPGCRICGKKNDEKDVFLAEMQTDDCRETANFLNEQLRGYDMVIWRDEETCLRLIKEQKSENGGVLLARKEGRIVGVFPYAKEGDWEIREPVFVQSRYLYAAAFELNGTGEVVCTGYGEHEKPVFMAKILDPDAFLNCFGTHMFPENKKIFINEVV